MIRRLTEGLRGGGPRTVEEAREQTGREALETGKPVLMEKDKGRFRRVKTVFDLRTKAQRTLFRLLH